MDRVSTKSIEKIVNTKKHDAKQSGQEYIEITAKDVHDIVGGYANGNTRYPMCCSAMYNLMDIKDEIIYAPPKGKGSRLKIKYYL